MKMKCFSSMKRGIAVSFLFIFSAIQGCSSTPERTFEAGENGYYAIQKLLLPTLKFRRTLAHPASPSASPGGSDYNSRPLPDLKYDCVSPSDILRAEWGGEFSEIRSCLLSLQKVSKSSDQKSELHYKLKREAAPYWELQDEEKAPPCVRKVLARIPVPREILFQSPQLMRDTRVMDCFSSRLDIEADRVLDVKLPIRRVSLTLSIPSEPITRAVLSDRDLEAVALTWALAPFWSEEEGARAILARIVPLPLCSRCIGEKNLEPVGPNPKMVWP